MNNKTQTYKSYAGLQATVILCLLCLSLSLPSILNAESNGARITYVDSIVEDEEGESLSFPTCVFFEPVRNEIYVLDGKSRIIIYTSDFFPLFTISKSNGIDIPLGFTVDADGTVYVAQASTRDNPRARISVFNACLKWERDIYLEGFEGAESFKPYRLAVDKKGNIYVAGSNNPGVLVLNNKGKFLEIILPVESDKEVLVNYVKIDQSGRLYIVSEEEGHIYVYDENRKFLFQFGDKGGGTGKLSRPQGVGIDSRTGRMYVVDYMRHTISAYDNEGKYLFEFGGLGWGEVWFQYPKDISADSSGRIFVADTFNNRIEVLKSND
jgi:DNA-binding beta-propeller fold protein YncE